MHSQQAELREVGEDLAGEDPLLEPVPDLVEHVLAHELPHGVPDGALFVVEQGVEPQVVERVERGQVGGSRHVRVQDL